jgi:mRNA interferase MazF
MSKTSHSSGMLSDLDQGDIIWLDFSPSVGHEQADYRPSLVISKRQFNKNGLVIVLPITRTPGPMKEEINCLPEKSYVMCDQPRTVDLIERKYDFDNDCYLLKSELAKILGRFKAIFL